MPSSCAICRTTYRNRNIKLYIAPRDPSKRKLWEQACGLVLMDGSKLCQKHFSASDFKNDKEITQRQDMQSLKYQRKRLRPTAVPSLIQLPDELSSSDSMDSNDVRVITPPPVKTKISRFEFSASHEDKGMPAMQSRETQTDWEPIPSSVLLENVRIKREMKKIKQDNEKMRLILEQHHIVYKG